MTNAATRAITLEPEVTLAGRRVRLEPLRPTHADALVDAAADGELWRLPYTIVPSRETVADYLGVAFAMQATGDGLPFAIVDVARERIVGSTRYVKIDRTHRRREIGYTWMSASAQGTGINTEAKLLMLAHAFDTCRCIRVDFLTDATNARSRAALASIGAKQEGIMRQHMIMPGGRYRDSVIFSIVDGEWPAVREHLQARMAQSA